jgi:Na+/phosphate symporter
MNIKEKLYIERTSRYIKKDISNELITLHDMINNAVECLSLLENSIIYQKSKLLQECNKTTGIIKRVITQLTKEIVENVNFNSVLKPYVSIPGHLLKIVENIENLNELIDKKNSESLLFSDKAVSESLFLLQRLIEMLTPISDIILARNTIISMYVRESQSDVERMATEYATMHEERLIAGVCVPRSASIYVKMLEAIKNIAWHSKEIAVKLAG